MPAVEAAPAMAGARGTGRAAGWAAGWPMGRFLRSELALVFRRRRNLASLAVLAAVPVVIAVAVRLSGPAGGSGGGSGEGSGGGPDFFTSIAGNGFFVSLAALAVSLPLILPLAVAAVAGDAVAGEAQTGTLRYLLTVPVHRTRLLAVKYAAVALFAVVATLVVAAVGVVAGLALFGGGPVTLFSGVQVSFAEGLLRLLAVCGYLAAGLCALGAVGLFVSTLTEQPVGATVTTIIVTIASFVLGSIPQLEWLHPYLLTQWWMAFGDLLRDPVAGGDLSRGLVTAAAYTVVFLAASWARFAGRDITS